MNALQLFNDNGLRTFGDFFSDFLNETPRSSHSFYPRTNIHETKDDYQIDMMVPGRKKEDFKISLDKGILTIAFETKEEKENKEESIISREFSVRSFSRSFSIDDKVDSEKIEAKYEDGILKLTLPKKEEVKVLPKEIAIK